MNKNDNEWDNPNESIVLLRCMKNIYAKNFIKKGQIKFNTPMSWVIYADKSIGRGDLFEGALAVASIYDQKTAQILYEKYKEYGKTYYIQDDNDRLYLKNDRDMQLPCYCLFSLQLKHFNPPSKSSYNTVKGKIPASYFRDFVDNMSKKDIDKLDENDKPVWICIKDYEKFYTMLENKLIALGAKIEEIESKNVCYIDFHQYNKFGWLDLKCVPPSELFLKHSRFEYQSERRIIINSRNANLLEILKKPIEIGSLSSDIVEVYDYYFYDGVDLECDCEVEVKE